MKKLILLLFFVFISTALIGQTAQTTAIQPTSYQVIVPVAGEFENENIQLSFTVGENAVGTEDGEDGSVSAAVGFQHPTIILLGTSLEDIYVDDIHIFPNPTSEAVFLDFPEEIFPTVNYIITDLNGKIMSDSKVSASELISLDGFTKGIYIISLSTDKGEVIGTYRVEKL